MTTVDRNHVLSLLTAARSNEDSSAKFNTRIGHQATAEVAADRAFSLSLLIDAVQGGLLDELAAKNEQLEREAAADFAHIAERDFEAAKPDPDPDATWAFIQSIPGDTIDDDEDSLIRILEEGVHDGPAFVSVLSSTDGGPDFADYREAKDTALVERLLEWKNRAVRAAVTSHAGGSLDDIQRPCTRCGDLNHASRDCEAEDPYDGMTNADVMTAEELDVDGRDAEFALDAADEARWAAESEA